MIRNIASLAVVVLAASIAWAGDTEPPMADLAAPLELPPVPDAPADFGTLPTIQSQPTSQSQALPVSFGLTLEDVPPNSGSAATSGASNLSSSVADDSCVRPYRPLCDCGCLNPCLDRWCAWDVIYCDTCDCYDMPCACAMGETRLDENGQWMTNDGCCDVWGPPAYVSDGALRFGWWGISSSGSQHKTGEYQDLSASPFYDVDVIHSDGVRTWNLLLSGLDKETNDVHLDYYGPNLAAKLDFERFIHRLDHAPLNGFDLNGPIAPGPNDNVVTQDMSVGEDYAIRVEELDAKFRGKLMDHVTWRMNVWSQRKFGDRQENATAHCFQLGGAAGNTCHVVSEGQSIDWRTVEVQPAVEARFQDVTVEYSHTIRSFGTNDDLVTRQYTHFSGFSPANDVLGPDYAYGLVPENFTQIGRLKVAANLSDSLKFYGNAYAGTMTNQFREMDRRINGYDLRLINTGFDDTTITGYASRFAEDTTFPGVILTTPPYAPANTYDADSLREPIDYTRTRAGIKASWQPYGDRGRRCTDYGLWEGTTITSGYEYYLLERDNAVYRTKPNPPGLFAQADTTTNQIEIGPATRWSRSFDTFVRYRLQFIENPLVGISEYSIDDPDVNGTFNSNQPEQVHNVDLGYTWSPYSNFVTTAEFTIRNSWNHSQYANFSENNYPMSFTAWYAPTCRLSLTGGYAYYSDWIDQDITLGANRGVPADTETTNWNYTGENHLFSFNANYAVSSCVQLVGGYEWNRGKNFFNVPPSPSGADWSLLPSLSDVVVETQRVTTGIDWQPYHNTNLYARYILYDYDDIGQGLYSGTANMFLAGATRTW